MLNQSALVIYNVTNLLYEASHSQGRFIPFLVCGFISPT